MPKRHHVAILGGGLSGTALAIHLLRCGDSRLEVSLIEGGDRLGRGIAYGTSLDHHVLNTPADRMSVLPDDPRHFVRWLRRSGEQTDSADFVSRRRYGDYVESTLLDALREAARGGTVFKAHTRARAAALSRDGAGFNVHLDNGGRLCADDVVLALGLPSPADPLSAWVGPRAPRYVRNPWQRNALAEIGKEDRVLILGTGLTMVDVVLTLSHGGHRGAIHALSRNGLLPREHAGHPQTLPVELHRRLVASVDARRDVRRLTREIREIVADASALGIGWHAVFDALRLRAQDIWRSLDDDERRRFIARLRPFWEVHRHRIAPEPARAIAELMAQELLEIRRARVVEAVADDEAIEVVQRLRDGASRKTERYQWVVNCTGPSYRPAARSPLERRLLARGWLKSDALGLGYMTTPGGAVLGKRGVVRGLHLLGPACRPIVWECTAVPELRDHAEALAVRILAERRGTGVGVA